MGIIPNHHIYELEEVHSGQDLKKFIHRFGETAQKISYKKGNNQGTSLDYSPIKDFDITLSKLGNDNTWKPNNRFNYNL